MDLQKKMVLFADLDDTLIQTASGDTFARDCTDFRIKKDVIDKIKCLKNIQCIVIVTNQGGIPQYVSEQDFYPKLLAVREFIRCYIHKPVFYEVCTANDPKSFRKPNTGMLEKFLENRQLTGLKFDKSEMLMIGDASGKEGDFSDSDKKCAENFGIDYLDVDDFLKIEL